MDDVIIKKLGQNVQNKILFTYPGDFKSWESPQTLTALFIGPFEHVFAVKRITNIQSTVLSSSEGTAAIHLAFKYTIIIQV